MKCPTSRIPAYRYHKARNAAVVTLDGRDYYLGDFDSQSSREKYARLISQWCGGTLRAADDSISVNELILGWMRYAQQHYKNAFGEVSREPGDAKYAFRPLKALYGSALAKDFGPQDLKIVRRQMISSRLERKLINKRIGYIRRLFKWGVSEQIIPPSVAHSLASVEALKLGRDGARETEPVKPVSDEDVDAILPYLTPTLKAMVLVQRLAGMRSGELCRMTLDEIDRSEEVWIYKPRKHKTAHLGHAREIALGPRCQEALTPYCQGDTSAYLFCPKKSTLERLSQLRQTRKTKVQPSQVSRAKAKRKRPMGDCYDTRSFGRALRYAMQRAVSLGVLKKEQMWHPHQLRHAAAQRLYRKGGLPAVMAVLGHRKPDIAMHYSGSTLPVAKEIAYQMG